MEEIKTLKDLQPSICNCDDVSASKLRIEIVKIIKNLQGPKSIYPLVLDEVPESIKGEYAKDLWHTTHFKYGAEYGMIAILMKLGDITEKDLK